VGERREREREGVADRWGWAVRRGTGARSWAAWAGEERGEAGAARFGPETAQLRGEGFSFFFLFSVFYFTFPFSIFVSFYFLFF
jgi:hypothetical protein